MPLQENCLRTKLKATEAILRFVFPDLRPNSATKKPPIDWELKDLLLEKHFFHCRNRFIGRQTPS